MAILHDQRHGQMNSLRYLDLSYLNISWLPDYIFEYFPNTEVLKLNNNPIWDMNNIKYAIRQLKNLKLSDLLFEN